MDWSHFFCSSCHDSCYVLLKKFGKKQQNLYQKRDFASSNPTHLWWVDGSARPGTKSLGYGSESITQFISSISTRCIWVICLQFIYITSSITILNRYDIPIIYLYLYHSIHYDNRYVCIIKRIYETYTDRLLFAVYISFLPVQCHISYWTQWPSCHCHWKILR